MGIGAIRSWFGRQIDEIAGDRVLRLYGVALAGVNAVTFLHWMYQARIDRFSVAGFNAICWPFWESCNDYRFVTAEQLDVILWSYLALSIATGLCFLSTRRVKWGYWGLVLVNVIRVLILVQDFRMRLNQHYMANWVALAYLFLPGKRTLVPALIVSFYFWAGVLKLDWEWLSGAALYHKDRFWVPDALIPASCVYVVVLEMLLIWGVYARRNWLFWATIAQLILFHVFSWPVVGFYYPLLMFGLLSLFVLERVLEPAGSWVTIRNLAGHRLPAAALLGGFAALQMVPYTFPGDTALTGEGRLFALHMFDAQVECEAKATIHFANGTDKEVPAKMKGLPKRIECDPVVYFSFAREQCKRVARSLEMKDFDLHLRSRRTSDPEFKDVINVKNYCAAGLTYDMWRPNGWILK